MKYFIAIIILILNLLNYQHPLNSILFLILHLIFFAFLFFSEKKNNKQFIFLESMIISWPISWINIFGKSTEYLQLPWYYIFGLLFALSLVLSQKKPQKIFGEKHILLTYVYIAFYSIIPLITAHSFKNALGDFIMLLFYIIILFSSYTSKFRLKNIELQELKKVFIFVNFISALGIIFQFIMYKSFGILLFKLGQSGSFSGNLQISCSLLFEDTSCSTIMLGCGALYSLIYAMKSKCKWNYIVSAIIIIGLALTSRRTSVLTLIVVFVPYFLLSKQSSIKKVISLLALPLLAFSILFFLNMSRPVENYSQYTSDTGRIADYISGINVALTNPIGIGYGDTYLSSLMTNKIIPHNTLLRWIDMGGLFLAIPLIVIFGNILKLAKKDDDESNFWVLLYVFIASNFIPDILNSRFLLIICLFVILNSEKRSDTYEKRTNNLYTNL